MKQTTQESWRSGVCVCAGGGGARRRRRLGATGLGRNHEHTSDTGAKRERRAGLSSVAAPALVQVTLGSTYPVTRRFSKQSGKKGDTHTHTHTLWYWLVMHVRTKGIFFLNNEKKNLSIASSSSSYSFFVFCLFQITSFFLFFIFCRPHTHTHGILCPL
jgi:hypothetical protein